MKACKNKDEGYIKLAAAIISSGVAQHDEAFLKSEWCAELKAAVGEWLNKDTDGVTVHKAELPLV